MKPHRIIRNPTRNVGEPSSKYAYDRDGKHLHLAGVAIKMVNID